MTTIASGQVTPTRAARTVISFPSSALLQPASPPGRIYAADAGGFTPQGPVYVFSAAGTHQKPLFHFGRFRSPYAVAVDAAGDVYVPDEGNSAYDGSVLVFKDPSKPAFLKLDDRGALPSDLAVGTDGTVYVANGYDERGCGGGGDVRVYARGAASASYTICDAALGQNYSQVNGIAVDARGDVFVTWEANSKRFGEVRVFTPGPHYTGHFLAPKFKNPYAIAIDARGNVVVSDVGAPAVEVFARGANAPKYTFAQTGDPVRAAFDATGSHLYVADALANQIDEYAYPSGVLVNTIAFPGMQLDGVAIFPPWTGP
jgi:sugar lactone lactonase YvrE